MSARIRRTVSLTPELDQFVKERLASGRYRTNSDVLCAGLQLLVNQERDRKEAFVALKSRLEESLAAAKRGELVDPKRVLDDIEAMKARRRAERESES